jgi:hypothetical protein
MLDRTAGSGAYTMAASAAYSPAWYDTAPGTIRPQTFFTQYLVDLVESGIPNQPSGLRLHPLFVHLRDRLARDGRPVPVERSVDAAHDFVFAHNAAPPEVQQDLNRELTELRQQLAEAEARRAAAEAARDRARLQGEARERALQAEIAERIRELEAEIKKLNAQAARAKTLEKKRKLSEAIDTAERLLEDTVAEVAPTANSSGAPSDIPRKATKSTRGRIRAPENAGEEASALAENSVRMRESRPELHIEAASGEQPESRRIDRWRFASSWLSHHKRYSGRLPESNQSVGNTMATHPLKFTTSVIRVVARDAIVPLSVAAPWSLLSIVSGLITSFDHQVNGVSAANGAHENWFELLWHYAWHGPLFFLTWAVWAWIAICPVVFRFMIEAVAIKSYPASTCVLWWFYALALLIVSAMLWHPLVDYLTSITGMWPGLVETITILIPLCAAFAWTVTFHAKHMSLS